MASNDILPEGQGHFSPEMPVRPLSTHSSDPTEHLYTNHFVCSVSDNITLYQYDVSIEDIDSKNGNHYEVKGRARCATIMQTFLTQNQLDPNIFVWYDDQKCLYSTTRLPTPQTKLNPNNRNQLNIKSLVNQWSTNDIHNYINGQTRIFPFDAIRILETLLKKSIQDRIDVINNKCYFKNESSQKLDNGLEKRHGFIQALHLSSGRMTLSIQTKLTTFYSNISLLEFIHKQIGHDEIPSPNDYKTLNRILNNCLIVTQQSNWKKAYEFVRFDHRQPGEITINTGDSLIEYYRKINIILTQTNYPCIQVYSLDNHNEIAHLPLELCRIKEHQVYDNPLPQAQESGNHIPTPEQRYCKIMDTLSSCDYNSNLLCRTVGFHINSIEEMLEFDARVLPSPTIKSGPTNPARVDNGRIFLDGHLFKPKPISTLAITYFGSDFKRKKEDMEKFIDKLVDVMKYYNIYGRHEEHIVEPIFEDIRGYIQSMAERNCQFIVCVMDERREDDLTQLKVNIKKCGTITYGIMTQCAVYGEIPSDEKSLKNYCENLVRKINFKNGGINTIVNLDIALKNKKSKKDFYMFFGADVIHPTNVTRQHPSIAAIVGSGDSSCSITAVCACKQYPKEGKCAIETIVGMTEMVRQLLDYNHQVNQRLPNKIVFYRDGVDDGQFRKVLDVEIPAIRQAFNQIYGDKSKHPLLTLIVVKKRHNTRFFTYNPNANQRNLNSRRPPKETDNMSIGCVIDTTIVHPYQHNFYLNSHNAYQGVNNPSLYHVLLDEIGFTADELQLLTYHLCFTDARSSASEAIPSVVHQADIAALNARDLFCNDDEYDLFSSSTIGVTVRSRPLQNPTPDDLDYEILEVHKNLKNRPVFG